ncbi:unnamed protein product [Adineta ricciae]|uniref:C2H2-type domain-containing protein n=1 Tax=Adineta ricciae TaxID=249248 RepID=A0A815AES4_ADIRI|nr:unnamed protein product [Adineta ricciae]CAF1609385.1 unnamed protein product [Adineta ricciae]
MASNANQLVLFDGDDDRMEIILGNIRGLSKVPGSCKFYIFCADPTLIQEKIMPHPGISNVSVLPSSNGQNIIDTLKKECDHFTSIIIIIGSNSCSAEELFTKQKYHGRSRLFIQTVSNPPEITLNEIIGLVKQHMPSCNDDEVFVKYGCNHCKESFDLHDDLLEHRRSIHIQDPNIKVYWDLKKNLAMHKKTNANCQIVKELEVSCDECGDWFGSNDELAKHVEKEHSSANDF